MQARRVFWFYARVKDEMKIDWQKYYPLWGPAALGLALLVLVVWNFRLSNRLSGLNADFASSTLALQTQDRALANELVVLDERLGEVAKDLSSAADDLEETRETVDSAISKTAEVEKTVGQITGTVSNLEKLSQTDPELLQKYSKVFFLNEHYAPERLVEIPKKYIYSETETETIHARVWPFLEDLLDTAKADKIEIYVKSGYRSFAEQRATKTTYTVTYGAGTANTFSADQGYSEHQLGSAVDFITTGLNGQLDGFEKTAAYQWLLANAHRFGFALSYPPKNAYYVFEPWHWRFVGVELASELRKTNKYFYDLSQRDIDSYLAKLFD